MKPHYRVITLLFCTPFLSAKAQTAIIVEYDYLKQEVSNLYYVNEKNDTIRSESSFIKIKESIPLQVRVMNLNVEALQVKTAIKNKEKIVSQNSGSLKSLIGAFSTILNPAMGIDLTSLISSRGGESSLKTKEFAKLYPDFSKISSSSAGNLIIKYDGLIRERLALISEWKGIANGVRSLRYDTHSSKKEALAKAEVLLKIIDEEAPELFEDQIKLDQIVDKIAAENASFLQMVLKQYSKEVKLLDVESLQNANSNVLEMALVNFALYEGQINSGINKEIYSTLQEIGKNYQIIHENPYEIIFNLTLEEEASELQINVLQKVVGSDSTAGFPTVSKIIAIRSPVGLGLANSIGMNFVRFANAEKDYFLSDDSRIVESNGNVVLPTLAVLINFFNPSKGSAKLGGHFAVGVPLGEDKNVQYLLGPSLILGRNNTVILNFGINIGKANRLGNGLKTGDLFTTSDVLPIASKYSFGYQFGLSFNMSELVSK